ncbi:MAG TPA: DinB family protein, partial [Vicinamibacteria bacterium]
LEAAPVTLAQATRGLSDEEARRRPSPEKWSIVEIACHLRDVERIFAERYTKIAHQDRPALWVMDNDRVAERLRYREASLPAVLKEWKRLRGDTVTLLRALPHARWQRTGMHPKRGEVSIEQLALIAASHDASHTARVAEIRRPDPPST